MLRDFKRALGMLLNTGAWRALLCLYLLVGAIGGGALSGGCLSSPQRAPESKVDLGRIEAVVDHVYDGDNVWLHSNGTRAKYRLIGVDTPEVQRGARAKKQAQKLKVSEKRLLELGTLAAARLKQILPPGRKVQIEFDRGAQDQFDRYLVYLFVPGASSPVNKLMISEGLGWSYSDRVNTRYSREFELAEREARNQRRGVWQR